MTVCVFAAKAHILWKRFPVKEAVPPRGGGARSGCERVFVRDGRFFVISAFLSEEPLCSVRALLLNLLAPRFGVYDANEWRNARVGAASRGGRGPLPFHPSSPPDGPSCCRASVLADPHELLDRARRVASACFGWVAERRARGGQAPTCVARGQVFAVDQQQSATRTGRTARRFPCFAL